MNDVRNRPAGTEDFAFLATMLGESAVWRPEKPTPTGDEVLADPRYAPYLAGWPRPGDSGLVAEHDGPVGAAWYRTFTAAAPGLGFIAEDVPELAIAVIAPRRHEGIGRRLLIDLIDAAIAQGHPALSLTVAEANPARRLYESVGFVHVEHHGTSWTMVRHVQAVRFFAVGTNMDDEHMRRWIPSARRLAIASLSGFEVRWHKRSSDGGKLAARRTGHSDDVIWGVLYEVDALSGQQIDQGQRAHGYREERVTVVGPDGDEHDASVYVACDEKIDDSTMPTRSYRDPIVNAARANGLPAEYVDELARTPVVDP